MFDFNGVNGHRLDKTALSIWHTALSIFTNAIMSVLTLICARVFHDRVILKIDTWHIMV